MLCDLVDTFFFANPFSFSFFNRILLCTWNWGITDVLQQLLNLPLLLIRCFYHICNELICGLLKVGMKRGEGW
jgi:hypothetical protein